MKSIRKTSLVLGALYLLALATALLRSALLDSILDAPGYLTNLSANEGNALWGVIFLFIMGIAIPSICIVFYPILSKQNKTLALGYVLAGIIECALFLITVIAVLTLLTLSKNNVISGALENTFIQSSGILLLTVRDWAFNILWPITIGIATLILYTLLYQSELIPRWLSIWGFLGSAGAFAGGFLGYFGVIGTLSIIYNVLLLQIAVQELVMAIWLLARGFNPTEILAGASN